MGFDNAVRLSHKILFGGLVFFGIIEGSVSTWLTVRFNEHNNYLTIELRDRVRFLVFTSWWTVFFCSIYGTLFVHSSGGILTSVASHGVFLFLTWIFWTAGVASITTSLGGGINCSTTTQNIIYCNQLNAAEGFAWLEWVLTTVAFAMVIVCGIRSLRRGDGTRGSLVV